MTTTPQRAARKEIFGWAMFDFANSSYTTVIITVVYCNVFIQSIVGTEGPDGARLGNLLWSLALSLSYCLVVVTAPVLGAIMDFTAGKKRFLFASYLLTVLSTASLYWAAPGQYLLAIGLVVLSNFGFAVGESFASSFLPDLGPREQLGRISGLAWGLGYMGGLASTLAVTFVGAADYHDVERSRWVGPITAGFFLVAAVPTFLWLKQRGHPATLPVGTTYLAVGFRRVWGTFRGLREYRDLMIFLVALFFAMAGLSIVISFTFVYGDQVLSWSSKVKISMFILTQLTAAGGAVLFGYLQDRYGAKRVFQLTLWLWIICVTGIWQVEALARAVRQGLGLDWDAQAVFLVLGGLAGLSMGATQSAGRALVGLLSPAGKSGEFFGFWGLSGKLAAIFGLVVFGLLQTQLGLRHSIPLCSVLFLMAYLTTLFVSEKRGRLVAEGAAVPTIAPQS